MSLHEPIVHIGRAPMPNMVHLTNTAGCLCSFPVLRVKCCHILNILVRDDTAFTNTLCFGYLFFPVTYVRLKMGAFSKMIRGYGKVFTL